MVTYNPRTYRKEKMDFEQKLNRVKEELLIYRRNYREQHQYQIKIAMERFGKNIIITDNTDWSTEEISLAYTERSKRQFRKSKSPLSVPVTPQYHWTDSKIRVHILTCVVAMVYFSIFRNRLKAAGITLSAEDVLKELRDLRTALSMAKGSKKLNRRLEDLTKTQSEVLKLFGYAVKDGWVLQNSKP